MAESLNEPVTRTPADIAAPRAPDRGIAICLSGGGYRAMLFHVGALWRLQELRYLDCTATAPRAGDLGPLARLSSVSGGSITAAQLGLRWSACKTNDPNQQNRRDAFVREVVAPIRNLAGESIAGFDAGGVLAIIGAIVLPGSVNDYVAHCYSKHLYGDANLQTLPDEPRFVINASNLQSGALWRFMKPYMRDWRVGEIRQPTVSLARAVAASSAFPPPLSPAGFKFSESEYTPNSGGKGANNLQRPPFTTRVQLSDGGVYDNLGLETAWKHYKTILVSNAGKPFVFEEKPSTNWVSQAARVLGVVDNQVRSLRVRQLIDSFTAHGSAPALRSGCYWGIDTDINDYSCPSKLPCSLDRTRELAELTTDLGKKDPEIQERLINWGYAVTDAAMRTWVDPSLPPPQAFPYARGV